MSKVKKSELTTLALRKCYALLKQYPDDWFVESLVQSLINDLVQKHNLGFEKYASFTMNEQPKEAEETTLTEEDNQTTQNNKYRNIKEKSKKAKDVKADKNNIVNYMLADYAKETTLKNFFDETPLKEEAKVLDALEMATEKKNILVLKPFVNLEYIQSEKQVNANDKLANKELKQTQKSAKRLGLNLPEAFNQSALYITQHYVVNSISNDWSYDMSLCAYGKMLPFQSLYLSSILKDTPCDYLALISIEEKKHSITFVDWVSDSKSALLMGSILYPYLIPVTVGINCIPERGTSVVFNLVNPTNGKVVYSKKERFYQVQSKPYIDDFIYDCLKELKQGGEK